MKIALAILVMKRLGGKQRDCVAVGKHLMERGHEVTLLTTSPGIVDAIPSERVRANALTNHGRMRALAEAVEQMRVARRFDAVIAFDPLPGCDFHVAVERCLAKHAPGMKRRLPRYRTLLALEHGVFRSGSKTKVFYLTEGQRDEYWEVFGAAPERAIVLPVHAPSSPALHYAERERTRRVLSVSNGVPLAISVAQNPLARRKGLDRTFAAMAQIPDLHLVSVGSLQRRAAWLASAYGVADRVRMLPYVENVMDVMGAADVLLHPARLEAGGLVIVEALLAGIPVVTTQICGYAVQVARSGAGVVIDEPFRQDEYTAAIRQTLGQIDELKARARAYALSARDQETWLSRLSREVETQIAAHGREHAAGRLSLAGGVG
jgi:UDP-glucose:(heptosyl)LPS alpha-1,3-glucosyltransferase